MKNKFVFIICILVIASCNNQNADKIEKINAFKTEMDFYVSQQLTNNDDVDSNKMVAIFNKYFDPISYQISIDSCMLTSSGWSKQTRNNRWFEIRKHINDSLEMFSSNTDLQPIYGKITSNYEAFLIKGKSEYFVEFNYYMYLSKEEEEKIHAHQLGFMSICLIEK